VGDADTYGVSLERDVMAAARECGTRLVPGRPLPWLTSRGHLEPRVQRDAPGDVIDLLDDIHRLLGGNRAALAHRHADDVRPDLIVADTGQLLEVDELQHFTAARRQTLACYPAKLSFGFSIDDYRALIDTWLAKAHAVFTRRWSPDFDFCGGRRAPRAYQDSVKDLLAPVFTGLPVLRVPVPDRDVDATRRLLMPPAPTLLAS
jgi:hypothetical protein